MFVDQAVISVRAGSGGRGAVSFRREKFAPKGGPDGGNGGDGGSVIVAADEGVHTLLDFRSAHHWRADDGSPGEGSDRSGAAGRDLVMRLPAGTIFYDDTTGELIHDLKPGENFVLGKGGRGGWGNSHFRSSTNQTPRTAGPGEQTQARRIRLELKLIADAGIIGLPNAGKSTLLAAVTRATPKIADYPFTTLSPQLGIAELDASRRIVFADIPGLIEGASQGHGLGHDFLRHIERTRVLVHLIDVAPPTTNEDGSGGPDAAAAAESYRVVRAELAGYSPLLAEKQEIIALNKLDLVPDAKQRAKLVRGFCEKLRLGHEAVVIPISGAARDGTRELLEAVWAALHPPGSKREGWTAKVPAVP